MSTITGTVTHSVTIGSGTYASPLTIAAGAEVSLSGTGTAISSASLATLADYGSVYATSSGGIGVDLGAGGYASIGTSGRVEGYGVGIEIAGAGTVTNAGTIAATVAAGFGIDLAGGGTVIDIGTVAGTTAIAFGGTGDNRLELDPLHVISGIAYAHGTQNVLELLSTGNAGTIAGLGSAFAGFRTITVDLGATWTLTGDNTLGVGVTLIDSGTLVNDGALFTDGGTLIVDPPDPPGSTIAGTVLGSVTITGAGSYASPLTILTGGAVTVGTGYAILGSGTTAYGVFNYGKVVDTGTAGGGISLAGGGIVANGTAGLIEGYDAGVYIDGAVGTVRNFGTIEAKKAGPPAGYGVELRAGGYVYNGGLIVSSNGTDASEAVNIYGSAGTVVNSGTILSQHDNFYGVYLKAGGDVDNRASSYIGGGVKILGSAGTVVNRGTITDPFEAGLYLKYGGTVIDAGTITGSTIGAVVFKGGSNNLLELASGYRFVGGIYGDFLAQNTLELSGNLGAVAATYNNLDLSNFQTLEFGGDYGHDETFVSTNTPGAMTAAVANFTSLHDIFDFRDLGTPGSYSLIGNLLTVTGGSGTVIMDLVGSYATKFHVISDGHGGTDVEPACFARGTLILTERGDVPVEQLAIGNVVVTRAGVLRPIKWIGRRSYRGAFLLRNSDMWPICVRAGALADGVPRRDLYLSAKHALYFAQEGARPNSDPDCFVASPPAMTPQKAVMASEAKQSRSGVAAGGVLVPVECLVNGLTIIRCRCPDEIEYSHIELASHDVILAEGAAAESFLDCDNRRIFHNADEFALLYPNDASPHSSFCAPRVEAGRQLARIRRRLLARAPHCAPARRKPEHAA